MSMFKGLVVGFLWGGIIAGVLTLVLALALSVPGDQLADGAAMPELAEDAAPEQAESVDANPIAAGVAPDAPAQAVAALDAPEGTATAPDVTAEASTVQIARPGAPSDATVSEVPRVEDRAESAAPPRGLGSLGTPDGPAEATGLLAGIGTTAPRPAQVQDLPRPPVAETPGTAVRLDTPSLSFAGRIETPSGAAGLAWAGPPVAPLPDQADVVLVPAPALRPGRLSLDPPAAAVSAPVQAPSTETLTGLDPVVAPAFASADTTGPRPSETYQPRPVATASVAPGTEIEPLPATAPPPAARVLVAPVDPLVAIDLLPMPRAIASLPDWTARNDDPVTGAASALAVPMRTAMPVPDETVPEALALPVQADTAAEPEAGPQIEPDAPPGVQSELPTGLGASDGPIVRSPAGAGSGLGLPQVASALPSAEDEAPPAVAEAELPALIRYGAAFDQDETRALLAIVLRAEPGAAPDLDALAALPVPVSIALDPGQPDQAALAAELRAAGLEIIVEIGGLAPANMAAQLGVAIEVLPETVAFLDGPEGRLQTDRDALDAVLGQMMRTGQGLLLYPRGFNTAERAARQQDFAAATLFRDLGDVAQADIGRVLDRAGFAAGLEGGVVVVAPLQDAVIGALVAWSLGDRSEAVALAPVSAVLRGL